MAGEVTGGAQRFACTACGACCTRGPEMELGETAALADSFVLLLMVRVPSLPLAPDPARLRAWAATAGSRLPPRVALDERRRHLAAFAARRRTDRRGGRETFLSFSAIVADYGDGGCPALVGPRCGLHDRRPLTCRTLPCHYSHPASTLGSVVAGFTGTSGHACATVDAPVLLLDGRLVDAQIEADRTRALAVARADRRWTEALLRAMDDPATAAAAGLPATETALADSDRGYASLVPMLAAWRVAAQAGLMTGADLRAACRAQAAVIAAEAGRPAGAHLAALLPPYRTALAALDRDRPSLLSGRV